MKLSDLRTEKKDLIADIKDYEETLKLIDKAEQLDKRLPEDAKKSNSYVKQLEEDYPAFFDEDSENKSTNESINGVKEYVSEEKKSLQSKLSEVNDQMKNLHSEISKEDGESKTGSKRSISESETDTELSSKKIPRTDDNSSTSSDPSQSDAGS